MDLFYIEIPIFSNSFEMSDSVLLKLFFISTLKHLCFFLLNYRFLFILLGPLGKGQQYHEIGRSIATLMTDEVFIQVHWEHFPLLGTPNFWSSVFMTVCCESDFSVLNSPSFKCLSYKISFGKICSKGVINSHT